MNNDILNNNNNLKNIRNIDNNYNNPWFQVRSIDSNDFYTNELIEKCTKNQQQKRWILCIDGDEMCVQSLAANIDRSKLLQVNGQHQPVAFDKIARALLKGNCSTVILCDPQFTEQQMLMLQSCAKHGNTECIIINKSKKNLH